MKRLLLHSCCGPCSTAVIERLVEDWDVTVFYFNPNITDAQEYEHRKTEQQRFIKEYNEKNGCNVTYIEGDYDPELFFQFTSGYEEVPEGGARCRICFLLRLRAAAQHAARYSFDAFDTTLTVSPYKNYDVISEVGHLLEAETGVKYLSGNYKKKDGYRRSVDMAGEYNLYRQHYCGCVYSKLQADAFRAAKQKNSERQRTQETGKTEPVNGQNQ